MIALDVLADLGREVVAVRRMPPGLLWCADDGRVYLAELRLEEAARSAVADLGGGNVVPLSRRW